MADSDSQDKFDAIVIGAGPSGCACAYALAKKGKNVLVVEKGDPPGCKNVSGGRLYTYALEMLEPGMYKRAPLQRKVVREQIMMLGTADATTIDYVNYGFAEGTPQSYTVLRASLDAWFADEVQNAGGTVAGGIKVDELIEKDGTVIGIKAGSDEMYATVVIAAEGVNGQLSQKAGLFGDLTPECVGVGVKEVIKLDEQTINARFNVPSDEGAARVAIGCTEGIMGGAFLYTNKESISLGIVFNPGQAAKHGKRIHDILQDFKMHPAILALIEGGTTIEYGAHLVPELGLAGVPHRLYKDGFVVVGDAARFGINTGIIIRGMDLAIVSGLAAANAVLKARSVPEIGPEYMNQLNELMLLPNLKEFAGYHNIFDSPRVFSQYPHIANESMKYMFTVSGRVPEKMTSAIWQVIRQNVRFSQLAADGWKVYRSI
jgi:electron transfer flavoprotein-quinone oxidoreductase